MTKWTQDLVGLGYPLSFEGIVTTATDTSNFSATALAGWGDDYFQNYYVYPVWDAGGEGAAPQGEYKPISSYTSSTGAFTHTVFTAQLALTDKVLIIHPYIARMLDVYADWANGGRLDLLLDGLIADLGDVGDTATADNLSDIATTSALAKLRRILLRFSSDAFSSSIDGDGRTTLEAIYTALGTLIGTRATSAATGAVDSSDNIVALIKEIVTGLALDGSAPFSYDYTKATVSGWLHGFHMVRRILFVCPEALAAGLPNTVHNVAIKAELDKMGLVQTITQSDALTYPDYEGITLTVLGSPLVGTVWDTSNLAHIKAIFGLPIVCVDGIAAAYLKMGADGGNAETKTVLNARTEIEASILGLGIDDTTGLAAGANTVADAAVTFSTLNMSDTVTEIWYAWETTEANTDVLLGEIRRTMPDGSAGLDADGAIVPGTLAFYGCAYSMNGLNTLGKAVFHLLVERLLHSSTSGLAVQLTGNVGNLAATIGTKATPAATGDVSNAKQMMGYIKQLVTALIVVNALVDTAETDTSYSYIDAGGEQTVYEDTATTRRKISFAMDINTMTQGGIVKVYLKVDGSTYHIWITEDVDSTTSGGAEDVYTIEVITNQNFKVTYTEDANETAARSIPYSVVTKVME